MFFIFLMLLNIKSTYSQDKINEFITKISGKNHKGYFVENIDRAKFPKSITFNFNIPVNCFVKIELKNLSLDTNIVQYKYFEENLLNGYYNINCKLDLSQYNETDIWIIYFSSFAYSKKLETVFDFIIDLRKIIN